ncbi:hypothetical protein NA57DRAFT_42840 [Rhizodiscina lignyota]|uniref:Integral membrane protein n=1 Tax=Rhizodiscina lignyota TaxID=1504668 RepID=A0A9P4I817_9PEZI|nr:hypothetical protein NA57DRAFT_42840 [Rhizodiscina lignyota]
MERRTPVPYPLRVFLLASLSFLFCVAYGRKNFYRDPLGIFFDPKRAYERHYSGVREAEALEWSNDVLTAFDDFENGLGEDANIYRVGDHPRICAVFITAKREGDRQYIDIAVGSALANITEAERTDLDLKIYFSNTQPEIHPSWNSWIDRVVDESFPVTGLVPDSQLEHMKQLEKESKFVEKAGLDYSIALQHCYANSSAPFIMIFEGDILLADGWFARTLKGLRHIVNIMEPDAWMDMRLFSYDKSMGWGSQNLLGNNVPWICLALGLALYLMLVQLRRVSSTSLRPYLSPWCVFVICGIAVPAFVILFFRAGKASLLPPSPGVHRQDTFGCCNQALLFPREQVPGVAAFITEHADKRPHDHLLMHYSQEKQLARYALYPVQAQHLGFKSIVNPERDESWGVWNMGFENLQSSKLAREHERMVKEIYGDEAWE